VSCYDDWKARDPYEGDEPEPARVCACCGAVWEADDGDECPVCSDEVTL
jgi:uncharacterized paraquat-inducible protein A